MLAGVGDPPRGEKCCMDSEAGNDVTGIKG